jgi:hypothetical protein
MGREKPAPGAVDGATAFDVSSFHCAAGERICRGFDHREPLSA